mmetsp:Transcript_2562/g.4372  ORF Transcript_2562/g.4372 Transcript_2562/m.4372 type:complete len:194 (+) Transcript_2562:62-643(+)
MNGIYPTLSSNGRIVGCKSYGSLDSGLWIAGSVNVTATDNEIYESTTGFEVTVSKNLYATNNYIHNNVVGIGLYHPNMAGTEPDYPSYDNWVFENNHVYDNNLPNPAPAGTFQYALQSGIGLLLVGVSEHTIKNNVFEDNGWAGVKDCQHRMHIIGPYLFLLVSRTFHIHLTFPGPCSRFLHSTKNSFSNRLR